jgi:hypothetical protein
MNLKVEGFRDAVRRESPASRPDGEVGMEMETEERLVSGRSAKVQIRTTSSSPTQHLIKRKQEIE